MSELIRVREMLTIPGQKKIACEMKQVPDATRRRLDLSASLFELCKIQTFQQFLPLRGQEASQKPTQALGSCLGNHLFLIHPIPQRL